MDSIALEQEWVETAQLFGDAKSIVKEALRTYAIEQCQRRIDEAAAKIAVYARKYGMDHERFVKEIQIDEEFLNEVESENSMWEQDVMEWEYWLEEKKTWHVQLATIMQR